MSGEVEVTPTDLRFRFQPNKQLLATITITNPNSQRVAFKIKTTAPKKYVVRPSSGVVEARSNVAIQVIMQAQKEYTTDFANSKDKFMVQTTVLSDTEQIEKDTFNKEVRKDLKEYRLRVIIEGPAAPPSPVPEANEADEDGLRSGAGMFSAPAVAAPSLAAAPVAAGPVDTDARLRSTMDQLAAVSSEHSKLKQQVELLHKERDELRRQLDTFHLQAGSKGAAPVAAAAAKPSVGILHVLLAAIIAFVIGHFLKF